MQRSPLLSLKHSPAIALAQASKHRAFSRFAIRTNLPPKPLATKIQVFQPNRKMATVASVDSFIAAVKTRRTSYALTNKSTIPDSRVEELVADAIKHVPSAFNSQSARAVILFGDNHRKLWQIGLKHMKAVLPEEAFKNFEPKIKGLEGAYGTVMFFEDQAVLDKLSAGNPAVAGAVPDWSKNSAGMHHFTVWTALTLEGLGANLQHYNMVPPFAKEVTETWNLPETWSLNAQLVFGTPAAPPAEKQFQPVEDRYKVIA